MLANFTGWGCCNSATCGGSACCWGPLEPLWQCVLSRTFQLWGPSSQVDSQKEVAIVGKDPAKTNKIDGRCKRDQKVPVTCISSQVRSAPSCSRHLGRCWLPKQGEKRLLDTVKRLKTDHSQRISALSASAEFRRSFFAFRRSVSRPKARRQKEAPKITACAKSQNLCQFRLTFTTHQSAAMDDLYDE